MDIPRHWRLKSQRYALIGEVCPHCNAKLFPPRDVCPECGGPMARIPRRLIDRVLSLVRPVQRYRCRNFACQWVGNVRVPRGGNEPTDRSPL